MNEMMHVEELLTILGYSDSIHYYSLKKPSSFYSGSQVLRTVSRLNKLDETEPSNKIEMGQSKQVHGAYFFNTSSVTEGLNTSQVAVYVTQANTVEDARIIHSKLWNFGSAPFIITLLPAEIRIYTGFDYDSKNQNQGLLRDPIKIDALSSFEAFTEEARRALLPFSAQAIDEGEIWKELQKNQHFDYENRVDRRLLRNLEQLEDELLSRISIPKEEALKYLHALIGKYVYLRYLYDRQILTYKWAEEEDINLDEVFKRNATLSELLKLDTLIEKRFGGEIFPFPDNTQAVLNDEIVSFTADVFSGNEASGQTSFLDYDFSYIPVETLSFIYEQFLRAQKKDKKDGAIYTPKSLADYLLNEINITKTLARGTKVLDPCCGSGIFLVLTYQRLVEQELTKQKVHKLLPEELKRIMEESIYGVERNFDACDVTRFSLILTLLNYIEPPDLDKNRTFQFPNLQLNIFKGDFFDDSKEFYPLQLNFDWIIGNPPWKKLKPNEVEESLVWSWIKGNKKSRPVGDNRTSEAFAWRACEFLAEDGCIGFVLHAKSLFNHKSRQFRKEFFYSNYVRRITNFSNFQFILFPKAKVSAMTIIYQLAKQGQEKKPIWHYSPLVVNQIAARIKKQDIPKPLWTITVNSNEITQVTADEAEKNESGIWKMAFWGSYADKRAVKRLSNSFVQNLKLLEMQRGWYLSKGLELKNESETKEKLIPLSELLLDDSLIEGLCELDADALSRSKWRFCIPRQVLKIISADRKFYRVRGGSQGANLIQAPHAIITPKYAIYSDSNFVVNGSQFGVSAPLSDAERLQAITMYLSSSVCRYLLFFTNPRWGIDRTADSPKDWENLPIPSFNEEQIADLVRLRIALVQLEQELRDAGLNPEHIDKRLQEILDKNIEQLLKIPSSVQILIHDFFNVKLSLDRGRIASHKGIKVAAVDVPNETQLELYAVRLRNELDAFARTGDTRHQIEIVSSAELTVCMISLTKTVEQQSVKVFRADDLWKAKISDLRAVLRQKFSQWVYVQKEARFFDIGAQTAFICKSPRLIDWTESQAILDANDFIGDVLFTEKMEVNTSITNYAA